MEIGRKERISVTYMSDSQSVLAAATSALADEPDFAAFQTSLTLLRAVAAAD